ncbi:MAG: thiamine phosphate synthase [Marinifilaceae bacterium]
MNHKTISRLQYITNNFSPIDELEQIRKFCKGGGHWVQLRIKDQSEKTIIDLGRKAKQLCSQTGAILILNDYPHLAKTIGADGVHLGKMDMSPKEARKIVGDRIIIGGTANTFQDIEDLWNQGVDYIGLGPLRFTSTKKNLAPVLGFEGYRQILQQCTKANIQLPIVAIGGITPEDVEPLQKTGIHGLAISSGISTSEFPEQETQKYLKLLNNHHYGNIKNSRSRI